MMRVLNKVIKQNKSFKINCEVMYAKTYDTIDGFLVSIRIELQFDFMISS